MNRVVRWIENYYPKFYLCTKYSDYAFIKRKLDKKKIAFTYNDYKTLDAAVSSI